jgi:dTDP-4-amino-4,6-dideoxygalactose transaminase
MEPFLPTSGAFPIAEAVADRTLALPFYNNFRRTDAERAAKQLCRAIKSLASCGHGVRAAK